LRFDEAGCIAEIAHETHACVLAQASASILGAKLAGTDEAGVKFLREEIAAMLREGTAAPASFADYAALAGAATFRNRHSCVLLPVDAVLDAFSKRHDS
jgi:NifU-like protein involved in Fe-S cluster formation